MITQKLHSPPCLASSTALLAWGGYLSVSQTHTTLRRGNRKVCACLFVCNISLPYLLTTNFYNYEDNVIKFQKKLRLCNGNICRRCVGNYKL